MISAHLPVLIPLIFLLAALAVPLAGRRRAPAVALGAASAGAALAGWGLLQVTMHGTRRYHVGGWQPPVGIEFVLDPLAAFVVTAVTGVAAVVLWHGSTAAVRETPERTVPFFSTTMIFLVGLTGMVLTGDLFNLYVFLEISSLAGYALLAVGNHRAPVSTFRYLTLGTAGASFYLLGLAFVYAKIGTLNMGEVSQALPLVQDRAPVWMGLVLMGLGMGVKMALFPLHGWLPDAYSDASSTSTALIAPIGTKVAAYVLFRLFFFVLEPAYARDTFPLLPAVGYLGMAGILWGSMMAITQKELKRMLAYSSVAQVGYIAAGIGLGSALGFIGAVLHLLNHACMKACLFLVAGNLRLTRGHSLIPRFDRELRQGMPWTLAAFTLAALSMIGLPPTAGFFSKWYLALAALDRSNWLFLGVLVLSTLLNAVYFFRVLERVYLAPEAAGGQALPAGPEPAEAGLSLLAPTLILAGALLLLGLGNAWIVTRLIYPMIPDGL